MDGAEVDRLNPRSSVSLFWAIDVMVVLVDFVSGATPRLPKALIPRSPPAIDGVVDFDDSENIGNDGFFVVVVVVVALALSILGCVR